LSAADLESIMRQTAIAPSRDDPVPVVIGRKADCRFKALSSQRATPSPPSWGGASLFIEIFVPVVSATDAAHDMTKTSLGVVRGYPSPAH
jgi:hypothetical protein